MGDAIKVWSVHDYKCSERKIRAQLRNYKWHDKLAKAVAKSVDGDKDWVTYMRKDQFGSQRPTATGTRMSPRPKSSAGGSRASTKSLALDQWPPTQSMTASPASLGG